MESRYTIELLGVSISIRTEENVEYIRELVRSVEGNIRDVENSLGLSDPLSVAVMVAVFLTDENVRLKNSGCGSGVPQSSGVSCTPGGGDPNPLAYLGAMLDRTLGGG